MSLFGVKDGYPVDKKLLQKARIVRRMTIRWLSHSPGSFQGDNAGVAGSYSILCNARYLFFFFLKFYVGNVTKETVHGQKKKARVKARVLSTFLLLLLNAVSLFCSGVIWFYQLN